MSVFGNTVIGKTMAGAMLLGALAMSGCGGDAGGATPSEAESTPSFEDAMVNYAVCMREHGVDMPDPQFADDGGTGGTGAVTFAIPLGATDAAGGGGGPGLSVGSADPTTKAATEACQPIMDAVTRNMPKPSAEEEAKMRDDASKFAQCMREHGVDMPDPTFDAGGGVAIAIQGSSDGPESGDSDKFNEASSACSAEGLGGGFTISSADGSTGGLRIGTGASK